MPIIRGAHSVYNRTYHLVLVVKYRRKCISDEIGLFLVEEASRIVAGWGGTVLEGKADRDHLHLMVCLPPKYSLSSRIGTLKQLLGKAVRNKYQSYISRFLWGDSFWSDSYYIASVGDVNQEKVAEYIRNQGSDRRYTRGRKHFPFWGVAVERTRPLY